MIDVERQAELRYGEPHDKFSNSKLSTAKLDFKIAIGRQKRLKFAECVWQLVL